jgi:TolB-like protein/DNA-binding SARP family transcriptional activator
MYRLRTFGGLILERDGVPVDEIVPQRKALGLLAILAVHGTMGRERLMALLWPESEPDRARGSLKQAIHSLRRQLAEPELLRGTADLRLNAERIECDAQAFAAALGEGRTEDAVSLYRGPFLDGVHLDGTPDFERWVDGWRDDFAARYRQALESLAVEAGGRSDTAAAVAWWRRLQGADPLSGRVALRLMEALDRSGDPAAALRHARLHEILLSEELSVAPDPAITAYVERLRSGGSLRAEGAGRASTGDPPGVVEASSTRGASTAGEPPSTFGPGRDPMAEAPSTVSPGHDAPGVTPSGRGRLGFRSAAALLVLTIVVAGAALSNARSKLANVPDQSAPGAVRPSVAILPLLDMSAEGDLEYLADGLAEEILNSLAGLPEIRVSARTSSFHFRGRSVPVREIADRLGVDHVLEGSLRRADGHIRVTAQLIDARADRHLWSRTFDSEFQDVFAVQEEIARAVAEALRVRLAPDDGDALRHARVDPEAHDLYLRGLFHWNRRSAPDLLLAIELFERAVALDPGYARPWAGLALVYAVVPIGFTPPLDAEVARDRLERAADRALALDSTLADVHAARGLSYHFEWRWDEAEREYRRALELDPRHATAHQWYGEHLAKMGRGAEAVASLQRALELDPLSLVIRNDLGLVLLLDRQPEAAREAWHEALRMDPSFTIPHYFLHRLDLGEGRLAESEEWGRRWAALTGTASVHEITTLTRAVAAPDLRPEALAILDAWASGPAPRWLDIAFYRMHLGAHDEAIEALEQGVRTRAPMMAQIGHSPWLDPLRGDPRLRVMVRVLGFPARVDR